MRALVLLVIALPALAADNWSELANTAFNAVVCPANGFGFGAGMPESYAFADNCHQIKRAWGGMAVDRVHSIVYLWGGGHVAYRGNEIYAMYLDARFVPATYKARTSATVPMLVRLTDPSIYQIDCSTNVDGTLQSLHSYQSPVYLPRLDKIFIWLGANYCANSAADSTIRLPRLFDVATQQWETPDFTWVGGIIGSAPSDGAFCVLDTRSAHTRVICSYSYRQLWAFDLDDLTATPLTTYSDDLQSGLTLVFDPDANRLYSFGSNLSGDAGTGKVYSVDLATNIKTDITSEVIGCDDLKDYPYPGLDWDPSLHRVVGYVPRASGTLTASNKIVVFDPSKKQCVNQPTTAGPTASDAFVTIAAAQGIHSKFARLPALEKYVVVNSDVGNAWTVDLPVSILTGTFKGTFGQ